MYHIVSGSVSSKDSLLCEKEHQQHAYRADIHVIQNNGIHRYRIVLLITHGYLLGQHKEI